MLRFICGAVGTPKLICGAVGMLRFMGGGGMLWFWVGIEGGIELKFIEGGGGGMFDGVLNVWF